MKNQLKEEIFELLDQAPPHQFPNKATQIIRILNSNPTVTTLDFDSNYPLQDVGVTIMASVIQQNVSTLKSLVLSGQQEYMENERIFNLISNPLQHNITLTELDLSENEPTTSEAINLFNALVNNHTLCTLYLGDNHLGNEEAQALANVLLHNTTLTRLDLSQNAISNEGGEALEEALWTNKTLKELDLSDNQIDSTIIGDIDETLEGR